MQKNFSLVDFFLPSEVLHHWLNVFFYYLEAISHLIIDTLISSRGELSMPRTVIGEVDACLGDA